MKKIYILLLIIVILTSLLYNSCKKDNTTFTILRTVYEGTYITRLGGSTYTSGKKDSIIKKAAYYARVEGYFTHTTTDTILNYGHCWSLKNPPLITHDTLRSSNGQFNDDDSQIFNSRISNLEPETDYYFRSYIITTKDTAYNPIIKSFKTLPPVNEWFDISINGEKPQPMADAVLFKVGDKFYYGTGTYGIEAYSRSIWEYNPTTDVWKQAASIYGAGCTGAAGFGLEYFDKKNNITLKRGYILKGFTNGSSLENEFIEYNPDYNSWKKKDNAPFPGLTRYNAVSFSINDIGYIGAGESLQSNEFNSFWSYSPAIESDPNSLKTPWKQISRPTEQSRTRAVAFTIGSKAYYGLGRNGSDFYKDFYQYNSEFDSWTKLKDFPGDARANAVGFSIDDQGFVGLGDNIDGANGKRYSDFWKYDPFNGTWTERKELGLNKTSSYAVALTRAVGYGYNSKGYVLGGQYTDDNETVGWNWNQTIRIFWPFREESESTNKK